MKNLAIAVAILLLTIGVACSTQPKTFFASPPSVHQWGDPVSRMCHNFCRPTLQKVVDTYR